MIDRSYLPFQSAREYQDRKMAKWMGFFLSEHSTSLSDVFTPTTFFSEMPFTEKITRFGQVYANQTNIKIGIKNKKTLHYLYGRIVSVNKEQLILKSNKAYHRLDLDDVLTIEHEKETDDESI